jgi:TolB protein
MFTLLKDFSYLIVVLMLFTCSKKSTDGEKPPPFMYRCSDFEAAWSPDGKTIAFISGGNPETQIPAGLYFVDPDGRNGRLFFEGAKVYSPDWSPDGEWIVFSNYAQIYKIKVNGDSLTQLTFGGENFFPDWSPDGKKIAYDRSTNESDTSADSSGTGIWIMDASGKDKELLHSAKYGEYPDWSPDGKNILCEIPAYTPGDEYVEHNFWIISLADTNRLKISLNGDNRNPHWSPDGLKIVFSSMKASPPQIFVMNSDGSDLKQLTTTGAEYPTWSHDSKYIVYTDVRQQYGRLFIMNADGSSKRQLTFDE